MKVILERGSNFQKFKRWSVFSKNVILQYPINIYIILNLYEEPTHITYNESTVILYSIYNF